MNSLRMLPQRQQAPHIALVTFDPHADVEFTKQQARRWAGCCRDFAKMRTKLVACYKTKDNIADSLRDIRSGLTQYRDVVDKCLVDIYNVDVSAGVNPQLQPTDVTLSVEEMGRRLGNTIIYALQDIFEKTDELYNGAAGGNNGAPGSEGGQRVGTDQATAAGSSGLKKSGPGGGLNASGKNKSREDFFAGFEESGFSANQGSGEKVPKLGEKQQSGDSVVPPTSGQKSGGSVKSNIVWVDIKAGLPEAEAHFTSRINALKDAFSMKISIEDQQKMFTTILKDRNTDDHYDNIWDYPHFAPFNVNNAMGHGPAKKGKVAAIKNLPAQAKVVQPQFVKGGHKKKKADDKSGDG